MNMSVPVAYAMMILVWATTPLTIKMSTESVDVVIAALSRVAIGALLGVVIAALLKVRVPWDRIAWRTYFIGNINIFVGVFFTFKGAQHLPSGMVSVLFGLSPVLSPIFARIFLKEQPLTKVQWLAALLGLGGLMLVFREQLQISPEHLKAVLYVLCAVMCFCASNVFLKRWPGQMSALAQTTGSLVLGIPLYLVLALIAGSISIPGAFDVILHAPLQQMTLSVADISDRSLYAILYLGVFGSLLGVMCYFHALTHLKASTVALATLITPIMALALGRWLNAETLTRGELAGAACIIGALALYYWGGNLTWKVIIRNGEVKHGVL